MLSIFSSRGKTLLLTICLPLMVCCSDALSEEAIDREVERVLEQYAELSSRHPAAESFLYFTGPHRFPFVYAAATGLMPAIRRLLPRKSFCMRTD